MSVNTKAILRKDVTVGELAKCLDKRWNGVGINSTSVENMFILRFDTGEDYPRNMYCHFYNTTSDYSIDGILVTLGRWGKSVEIMKYLCEELGGYLLESDCDDEKPWYPINLKKFESSREVTELDRFKNKVISKLGYDNLNSVMILLEEYKEIN